MIASVAPEWPLAAALVAIGWRLRPRRERPIPMRTLGPDRAPEAEPPEGPRPPAARISRIAARLRRRERLDAATAAAWCDAIARSLRSGATLAAAIVEAPRPAPVEAAVGPAVLRLRRGATTLDVIDQMHREAPSAHMVLIATVLRTVATHGGPAAEPVDRAASVLRQRAAAEAERATNSAQARLSARVMTLLPVAMLTVVSITSTSVRSALATPIGMATVTAGVCCNLVGWWWMRRIIAGGHA